MEKDNFLERYIDRIAIAFILVCSFLWHKKMDSLVDIPLWDEFAHILEALKIKDYDANILYSFWYWCLGHFAGISDPILLSKLNLLVISLIWPVSIYFSMRFFNINKTLSLFLAFLAIINPWYLRPQRLLFYLAYSCFFLGISFLRQLKNRKMRNWGLVLLGGGLSFFHLEFFLVSLVGLMISLKDEFLDHEKAKSKDRYFLLTKTTFIIFAVLVYQHYLVVKGNVERALNSGSKLFEFNIYEIGVLYGKNLYWYYSSVFRSICFVEKTNFFILVITAIVLFLCRVFRSAKKETGVFRLEILLIFSLSFVYPFAINLIEYFPVYIFLLFLLVGKIFNFKDNLKLFFLVLILCMGFLSQDLSEESSSRQKILKDQGFVDELSMKKIHHIISEKLKKTAAMQEVLTTYPDIAYWFPNKRLHVMSSFNGDAELEKIHFRCLDNNFKFDFIILRYEDIEKDDFLFNECLAPRLQDLEISYSDSEIVLFQDLDLRSRK